jgi:iron complex outermembrane receptor protein
MCLQNLKPIFSASLVFLCGAALADATQPSAAMSLEDLMQVEVTSVSKKPQRLANVAASIFVITAEDIRLSGGQLNS